VSSRSSVRISAWSGRRWLAVMVLSLALAGTPVVLASPPAGAAEAPAVSCVDEQPNEAAARAMVPGD